MTYGRRSSDRRRRVLYTTQQADTPNTAASRRATERMREARRPTAAYGVRVQRRLRGRWFSLVPVRRRHLVAVAACITATSLLLCLLHYAAVAWPSIAYRPEIARPLRLDRPDSFGSYLIGTLLLGSAGISLMIYQLRRYRIDDYQGRYRLWRLVLIVLMLASVNSLVSIIQWSGALIDVGFGKRVALAGSDWIRLVVSLGGAILALRLIAEIRRSRWALTTLLAACLFLAISEAAKWKFITVESVGMWALVTASPLLAFTALFISLGGYLRLLYREVRQIEDSETISERVQQFKVRLFQRSEEEEVDERQEERAERRRDESQGPTDELAPRPKQRWWNRKPAADQDAEDATTPVSKQEAKAVSKPDADEEQSPQASRREASRQASNRQSPNRQEASRQNEKRQEPKRQPAAEAEQEDSESESGTPRPKRRWFGLRSGKPDAEAVGEEGDEPAKEPVAEPAPKPRKKRRFSLRLDPADAESTPSDDSDPDEEKSAAESNDEPKAKKRGLGGWFRSRKPDPAADEESTEQSTPENQAVAHQRDAATDEEDNIDPEDIDWDSLSKSERRRLRKKLRRQGNAA